MVVGLFTFSCWLLARDCCQLLKAVTLHVALSQHGSFLLQGWQKGHNPSFSSFYFIISGSPWIISLFINSTIFKRNPRCQKHFVGCYWSINQGLSSQIVQGERETTMEQGRKGWAKCEWECKRWGHTPMGHSQGTIPGCSDIGSSWKCGPKLFRSCWVRGIFHFLSEPRFIFIFSIMVYYRIWNIVPCAAQYDLVFYPFYI